MRTSRNSQHVFESENLCAARFLTAQTAMQASAAMGPRSQSRSPSKAKTSKYGEAAGGLHAPQKVLRALPDAQNPSLTASASQAKDDAAEVHVDQCICGDGLEAQLRCPAPRLELKSE